MAGQGMMAWWPSWIPLVRLLLVVLWLGPIAATAQDTSSDSDSSITTTSSLNSTAASSHSSTSTKSAVTRVVSIFYIDERAYEGLPYTLFHRDSGRVIGIDTDGTERATTFVITTTRGDRRPSPTHSRTDNVTTGILTLTSSQSHRKWRGEPSTITQGPATFEFTGARFGGANHTIVNRCSLNGTVNAACNLTHVGSIWYTSDPDWNGTFSTYSYNWTSGDRYGFAPVTITEGGELIGPQASATPTSTNAAAALGAGWQRRPGAGGGGGGPEASWWRTMGHGWLEYAMGAVFPAVVLVLALAL